MSGYQEVLTDPSLRRPDRDDDHAAHRQLRRERRRHGVARRVRAGLRRPRDVPTSRRAGAPRSRCPTFLARSGIVAIEGIDTRRLTRHLREAGAMRAVISTTDLDPASLVAKAQAAPGLVGRDLVRRGRDQPSRYTLGQRDAAGLRAAGRHRRAAGRRRATASSAFDSGIKYNILRRLAEAGCERRRRAADRTAAEEVLALDPDGVFLANGPGDPSAVDYLYGRCATSRRRSRSSASASGTRCSRSRWARRPTSSSTATAAATSRS